MSGEHGIGSRMIQKTYLGLENEQAVLGEQFTGGWCWTVIWSMITFNELCDYINAQNLNKGEFIWPEELSSLTLGPLFTTLSNWQQAIMRYVARANIHASREEYNSQTLPTSPRFIARGFYTLLCYLNYNPSKSHQVPEMTPSSLTMLTSSTKANTQSISSLVEGWKSSRATLM